MAPEEVSLRQLISVAEEVIMGLNKQWEKPGLSEDEYLEIEQEIEEQEAYLANLNGSLQRLLFKRLRK